MAQKRMFDKSITNDDNFLEMPIGSQILYFHLNMNADDDGFVNNWKSIMRMIGAKEDDMKILILKSYIIPFESGIIVIKHWRINNYLRNDRHTPTKFQKELTLLSISDNNEYKLKDKNDLIGIPSVNPDKIRIDNNNIYSQNEQNLGQMTLPNNEIYEKQFEQFYKNYPRKVKKQDVKKWFLKNKPNQELFDIMIKSLELFKKDKEWLKDNGQFIPHPTTWLNQKRWEEKLDVLEKENEKGQKTEYKAYEGIENLTDEEYWQLQDGKITVQELIEKGKLYYV